MGKIFNIILLICVLYTLYLYIQKYKSETRLDNSSPKTKEEFINLDKLHYIYKEPTNTIEFNYDQDRPIDKKFLKEQYSGTQLSTWYPNTWIESIDENGVPVYNSRENVTGEKENFIESKTRFTYEFNSPRSTQMDGIADPYDFKDGKGRTLKEVYDNSFVDYKKLVPKKQMAQNDPEQLNIQVAGSNLSYITPDTWIYDQEKPENGGIFENGLMADDPMASGSINNSLAVIDY